MSLVEFFRPCSSLECERRSIVKGLARAVGDRVKSVDTGGQAAEHEGARPMSKTKTSEFTYSQLKGLVLDTAKELFQRGPGWSQEGVALHEVSEKIGGRNRDLRSTEMQQRILTCWHDLFRSGDLSWGYNLDTPNSPFFHVPARDAERELELNRVGKTGKAS